MSGRTRWFSSQIGRVYSLILIACLVSLSGCGQYLMQGRVIEGPNAYITVVSKDDPRLNPATYGGGISNTQIDVVLDPNQMRPIQEGNTYTDLNGNFSMPISAQGAGFLMYDAQITATSSGYIPEQQVLPLPSGNKQLLIVLKSGKGKLNQKTDFIKETLKMGEPYMK